MRRRLPATLRFFYCRHIGSSKSDKRRYKPILKHD